MASDLSGAPTRPAGAARYAGLAGIVGLLGLSAAYFADPLVAMRAYLYAFMFVLAFPLGSLVLLMLQHLTGGGWGVVLRRPLEAAIRTLPLVALFFLPIALHVNVLYPWASGEYEAPYPKSLYLNPTWFHIRAISYFAVWIVLGAALNLMSVAQERSTDPDRFARRFRLLSGPGLVLYGVTITFAAFDWVMSLEPEWFSSIFGVLVGVAQVLQALAFATIVYLMIEDAPPYRGVATSGHRRDLGSLILAFTMIWAYMSVSQLILIWSANLKEEAPFYVARTAGGWAYVAGAIALFQFAIPFLMLLSRNGKRVPQRLGAVAGLIVVMRLVECYWLAAPGRPIDHRTVFVADLFAPAALVGVWLAAYAWELYRRPLLVAGVDPSTAEDPHG